jgi:hypothetical protein
MALNRPTSPAFHHGYQRGAGTLHTIVGEPAKRRILIGIGGDAAALEEDMLDVSLDEWLRGQDLPVARLEGQLGGMAHPFEWPVPRAPRKRQEICPHAPEPGSRRAPQDVPRPLRPLPEGVTLPPISAPRHTAGGASA